MSIPSEYRATPLLLELQVLRGGGVGVPGNQPGAGFLHTRPHAPDERQLVERDVERLVGDDLLDLVDELLALLRIELLRLPREEIVDPGMRAVGVDAVLRHVWLEPRGRVPEGGGDDEDHAVQLLLLPRGEIRGSLHRAQAALDPDRA